MQSSIEAVVEAVQILLNSKGMCIVFYSLGVISPYILGKLFIK